MKQVPIKLGPLALLLTIISICLTTLAILNFTTARADRRLAEKYAETVRVRYELEAEGQAYLRDMDALSARELHALEQESADEDGIVWSLFENNGSQLHVGLRVEDDALSITAWRHDKEWTQEDTLGNLWLGF